MTAATYTINHDRLEGAEDQGLVLTFERLAAGPSHRALLIDDDGITYYDGSLRVSDDHLDEVANDLWDWGAWYAGTTRLRIDGEDWIS